MASKMKKYYVNARTRTHTYTLTNTCICWFEPVFVSRQNLESAFSLSGLQLKLHRQSPFERYYTHTHTQVRVCMCVCVWVAGPPTVRAATPTLPFVATTCFSTKRSHASPRVTHLRTLTSLLDASPTTDHRLVLLLLATPTSCITILHIKVLGIR